MSQQRDAKLKAKLLFFPPLLPLSCVDSDCRKCLACSETPQVWIGGFHHYLERQEQGHQDYLLSYIHSNK